MDDVSVNYAKEHLEELIERARRGEDVTIDDGKGAVRILPQSTQPDRISDAMSPFVPSSVPRKLGLLKGKFPPPPDDFFAPLTDEELKDWYGEDS